ncbi:hypothetical protein ACWDUM_07745 [Rhodococcus sp. NPDC003322]
MHFELDSDRCLWRGAVRDVTADECPPTLNRNVVDRGADSTFCLASMIQFVTLTTEFVTPRLAGMDPAVHEPGRVSAMRRRTRLVIT